jgi:hypothetical protein
MGHKTKTYAGATVSTGNTKLGDLPNVSLTPIAGCPKGIPCSKQCYACKAYRQYPEVRSCWGRNLKAARKARDKYFAGIDEYLTRHTPKFFRWHVAGDILDQDYLRRMFSIARKHPKTRFLAFTKNHSLRFNGRPRNLTIVLSMWPKWGNTRKKLPRAWYQDGTETRIPDGAIECPGRCDNCGMCWQLPRLGKDVVFHKH